MILTLSKTQSLSSRKLDHMKDEFGDDIKIIMETVDTSDPMNPRTVKKGYGFKAIISDDEDAYNDRDTTANKEYKVCSISIEDIKKVNSEQDASIPTPPKSLKKAEGLEISVDNGSNFQITTEKVDGFKQYYNLRIERDY